MPNLDAPDKSSVTANYQLKFKQKSITYAGILIVWFFFLKFFKL